MDSADLVNRVTAGLTVEEALAAFVAACRRPDTLFITPAWFAPREEQLRKGLSEPITAEQAELLRKLVWQRVRFEDVLDWLDHKPMSWGEYLNWRHEEVKRERKQIMEEGIFPWEEVEASRADATLQNQAGIGADVPAVVLLPGQNRHRPPWAGICPRCRRPLTWIYFRSPAWTWANLCGRAGWLGLCDPCRLQVKFRLVAIS